jgi:hypothetical protein
MLSAVALAGGSNEVGVCSLEATAAYKPTLCRRLSSYSKTAQPPCGADFSGQEVRRIGRPRWGDVPLAEADLHPQDGWSYKAIACRGKVSQLHR